MIMLIIYTLGFYPKDNMKYILLPIILFQLFLSAEVLQMVPLCDDKPGIQQARCLIIENCVDEIERISERAPSHIRQQLYWNILMIRFNLGYPIDENDIFDYFDD